MNITKVNQYYICEHVADGGQAGRTGGEWSGRQQGAGRSCEGGAMKGGDVAARAAGEDTRNEPPEQRSPAPCGLKRNVVTRQPRLPSSRYPFSYLSPFVNKLKNPTCMKP